MFQHNLFKCMEHTIQLSTKAFINAVNPQAPKNKRSTKNGTVSVEDVEDEDGIDDNEAEWLSDWLREEEEPDEQEPDDDVVDFTAGDILGKALALINQVYLFDPLIFHAKFSTCRFTLLLKPSNISHCAVNLSMYQLLSLRSGFRHDGAQCMTLLNGSHLVNL